ncbi:MAG TPA: hypothetical protein VNN13_09155, partial [Methylomirabilota bacterium]|nr:hypothetical protein [Methylomirabilota bacterium]
MGVEGHGARREFLTPRGAGRLPEQENTGMTIAPRTKNLRTRFNGCYSFFCSACLSKNLSTMVPWVA